MKTRKLAWIVALILGICLGLILHSTAHGQTETEQPSASDEAVQAPDADARSKTDKGGLKITISDDGPSPSRQELLKRLTPEQIFELEKARLERSEDIPSATPVLLLIIFAFPVALVAVVLIFRERRNRQLHKTLAAMIEKGTPIPPELLAPEKRKPSDLRRGIVLVAAGLGIVGFFLSAGESEWGLGLIPLFIGAGYLIAWKLQDKHNGNR